MTERKNTILSLANTALAIIGAVATVFSCLIAFIVLVNPAAAQRVIIEFYNPITPTPQIVVVTQPASTLPPLPTYTPYPTFPPIPTYTTVPTATATLFVPPADGVLFEDTFDNSIKPDWTQITGTWLVDNGRLTKVAYSGSGWTYEWIAIRKHGWKNFVLSMDIDRPSQNSPDEVAIVVAQNGDRLFGIQISNYIYWGLIGDDYQETQALTGQRDYESQLVFNIQIEANNDVYSVMINGRQLQSITLPGYTSNGIMIGIDCYSSYTGCTRIDNVKATYLP